MKTYEQLMEDLRADNSIAFKQLFCQRLKELRHERNLSQKAVAYRLGYAVSTYANWEQGRTEPSIYDLFCLMSVFEIDANELFDFINNDPLLELAIQR